MPGRRQVHAGTCGLPVSETRYFREFSTLEVDRAFLKVPKPEAGERLRVLAPEGFDFTVKAWQGITHHPRSPSYRRARIRVPEDKQDLYGGFQMTEEVMTGWNDLVEFAKALEASTILFQCPSSLNANDTNIESAIAFMRMALKDFKVAWEPGGWSRWETNRVLKKVRALHAVDPFLTPPITRKRIYFRLHGSPPGKKAYYYNYTERDLSDLRRLVGDREGHVFFNNITSFHDAGRYKRIVAGR